MMKQKEYELLADIAKLLNKYGASNFESLASLMSSPQITQSLIEILRVAANVHSAEFASNSRTEGKKITRSILDELTSIKDVDNRKYSLLTELYQALKEKRTLATLRELKSFVEDRGLPAIQANAWQKAINPFVRSLIDMPTGELEEKLKGIQYYSGRDNGLEGWSKIILERD